MSESGKHGGGKREDQGGGRGGGGGQGLVPSHGPLPPDLRPSPPVTEGPTPRQPAQRRHLPRGIVIQLTGTEGKWDSLDDGELLFSGLHPDDEDPCPLISLSTEGEASPEEGKREPCSMAFPFPLSPSSPDSLGSCSPSFATPAPGPSSFLSPGPPSPTHRPAPARPGEVPVHGAGAEGGLHAETPPAAHPGQVHLHRAVPLRTGGVPVQVRLPPQPPPAEAAHPAQGPQRRRRQGLTHRAPLPRLALPQRGGPEGELLQAGAGGHQEEAVGGHAGAPQQHVQ
ncbi:unnamed protein product [Gadus morhua 'NCC']